MKKSYIEDTIIAISTPLGVGGVSVIRISGPDAKRLFAGVWINDRTSVDNFATHRVYLGKIAEFSTAHNRVLIDQVLVTFFGSPNSYTGEDVIEVSCHGSPLVTKKILEELLKTGARLAEPGEFTKRAFLNSKMDLVQAEAVADVIHASSEIALKSAQEQLSGSFSKLIKEIQEKLTTIRTFVEATIDFPEEDIEYIENENVKDKLKPIVDQITNLIETYEEGKLIREGIKAVIVGKPNVGKSSLLNALLGEERAIVHHLPGTTRDHIEEAVAIKGVMFKLIDTAGIRGTVDEVESIGIGRAYKKIEESDLVVQIFDSSTGLTHEDLEIYNKIKGLAKKVFVINKSDLKSKIKVREMNKISNSVIKVSASTGEGLSDLKSAMVDLATSGKPLEPQGTTITNVRHKECLRGALRHLTQAYQAIKNKESSEFAAVGLKAAMDDLGEITGEITADDILDKIFNSFCIGK
ncbi:tRNA uridine-5-carboxymethylaminomethyl(34) synthesis GTPase MnmE [bacterium]|nr:tRNA uridine-5-carboxymethylaminomethyl(34) synthesis GTPase MnmE [bacterium]